SPMPIQHCPENVDYRHVPVDFFERMKMATKLISTKYVALLGDDDLYLPSGLSTCLNWLERNPSDVGAVGRALYFFFQDGRIFVSEKNSESSNFPESVLTGLDRLRNYYFPGKIGAIAYGVYRSAPWKEAVRATYSSQYSCGYVYDTYLRTTLTYSGNISVCESITWMCSGENPPIQDSSSFSRKLDLINWLTGPAWSAERLAFRTSLVNALVQIGPDNRNDLDAVVDQILKTLTERYTVKLNARMSPLSRAKAALMRRSPQLLRQFAKRLLPRSVKSSFGWRGADIREVLSKLRQREILADDVDIEKFERLVLKFHRH
ncbi:MAG: hypothetical protein EBU84_19415, partial [Actinobacteria bacterium]|nr:hypothetical protein [Actinomycetota bacterium]